MVPDDTGWKVAALRPTQLRWMRCLWGPCHFHDEPLLWKTWTIVHDIVTSMLF